MEFLIVTGLSGAGKSVTINALEDIGESYRRYLEGYFRDTFNLAGTPLRVEFRTKANPYVDEQKKR